LEEIRPIVKAALYGKHAHINPVKVLREVTPEIARERIEGVSRTCWDLLFHIVYWQEMVLRAYQGDESPAKANDRDSWPDHMPTDAEWNGLVQKFENDLEQLNEMAGQDDLKRRTTAWPHSALLNDLLIMIAHNSYHLGQIVQLIRTHQGMKQTG
jgi:uncharacterized damage-inducible protein DinB